MRYEKVVSILMPSRKREVLLEECLLSIVDKTYDKRKVEILIKVDDDDSATANLVNKIAKTVSLDIKAITTPRLNGYGSLHVHMNTLASQAKGEFLFGFNDDVEMATQDWDTMFIPYIDKNFLLGAKIYSLKDNVKTKLWETYNAFPAIPKDLYNYLGYLQKHPMLDDWWEHVIRPIREQGFELNRWIDVSIINKRPDGGEITNTPADQTFLESRPHINWNHHGSVEVLECTNKLIEYINANPQKFSE